MTKILLMNIPGGPSATDYAPVAISRVMEGIDQSLNCDVSFFDLDYYRPSFDEIKSRIQAFSPRIIGFSAMLTPAYTYLKRLSNFIGDNFPDIVQVLGGQMSVISNIILLKTKIGFCCFGESEPAFSDLIRRLQQNDFEIGNKDDYMDIKGLVFLRNNIPYFTGYANEDIEKGLRQFNYNLISKFTNLDQYIQQIDGGQHYRDRFNAGILKKFLSLLYPENRGKKLGIVFASKGCVNRCSFCHRYYKGYKVIATDDVVNYIDKLKEDCDVGMIMFAEENFGMKGSHTQKLIEYLKGSNLNWSAGAVRVKNIDEQIIKTWSESGCVHINFGIESLSQKMLDVMDKKTTVKENINAIKLCYKYNIFTIIGLVIGMPGETEQTIQETIDNLSDVIPDDINMPYEICVNYVQAIPGTQIYEYTRRIGLIGPSLEDEEKYIESIYNANASDIDQYLNFTEYEKEEIAYWKFYIYLELIAKHIKKHGYINILKNKKSRRQRVGLIYSLLPWRIRKSLLKHIVILRFFGFNRLIRVLLKKLFARKIKKNGNTDISLKKLIRETPAPLREDEVNTIIFRRGYS
ncbi:MAG: hypothetical protein A2X54_03215 [Nitrospirae bacterium GWF2_44_13]|nr:MAG: hypothetical protein A2X54_03215 [Nitrospirae bacterium GWF2_44_13]